MINFTRNNHLNSPSPQWGDGGAHRASNGRVRGIRSHNLCTRSPSSSQATLGPRLLPASALPGKPESACRKGIAPNQYVGACPNRQTASHPGSGPGQAFGGTCSSALPGKVESPCRKGIAPNQYVGACPNRQTASHFGGTCSSEKERIELWIQTKLIVLARFPARWNHLAEKESRQINMLEQILVGEVM